MQVGSLTGHLQAQFSAPRASPQGCLRVINMAAGFPLTEQSQEMGKEKGSCNAFYDLPSEVIVLGKI